VVIESSWENLASEMNGQNGWVRRRGETLEAAIFISEIMTDRREEKGSISFVKVRSMLSNISVDKESYIT
jgi:hypothetical protein